MTRAGKKKVGRRMMRTRICDLPLEVLGEKIITRVPISSLRAVRSTCKLWKALTKDWVLGKASSARHQFLGFMTMDSKVCSLRFHLHRSKDKEEEEEDLIDLSIKQVDLFNQVKISKMYHCDGLLLCVAKDNSRLVVWNPYLAQTRWIRPRIDFHRLDSYALGYDINRNHKILRFLDYFEKRYHGHQIYEIYDFSSNSWRVLEITPDSEIGSHQGGVSLKGNTYFYAHESILAPGFSGGEYDENGDWTIDHNEIQKFLLCFDFTRETFGPRLPLPFHSWSLEDTVALSCVREEQLAVLHQEEGVNYNSCDIVRIWVTTRIEPNNVSWSKFLNVEMRPFALTGVRFGNYSCGSTFFIDEEKKLAVVFDIDNYLPSLTEKVRYDTAFIIGEDGYFKSVSLGVAPKCTESYCPQLVCSSSYLPSLVQLN